MKTKVHVLHLLFSYNIGGVERVILDVVTARRDSHVRYGVAVINEDYSQSMLGKLATVSQVFALKRQPGSKSPRFIAKLHALLRDHDVEVVHVRELKLLGIALMLKAARPGLKLVMSFHNTNLPWPRSPLAAPAINSLFARRVAISRAVQAECDARGVRRVLVMNNAVNVARFAEAVRPQYDGAALRVICVARYHLRQKAQDVLIRAIGQVRRKGFDIRCRLLGALDGRDERDYERLQAIAREEGVEDIIEFVSNKTNVENYLADADLFVLPSHFEGFGNAVIEAMAAGLPVIASRVDGLAELVQDGVTGLLIRPADVDELVDKITWACGHRDELAALGARGRIAAEAHDIASYSARYEALYEAVMQNG